MIDIALIVPLVFCIVVLGGEDLWRNAFALLTVVASGLIAMGLFETLGAQVADAVPQVADFAETVTLSGSFVLICAALYLASRNRLPAPTTFFRWLELPGRWLLAATTSYLLLGFLLNVVYTAPMPADVPLVRSETQSSFLGVVSPDQDWLDVVNYMANGPFRVTSNNSESNTWTNFRMRRPPTDAHPSRSDGAVKPPLRGAIRGSSFEK